MSFNKQPPRHPEDSEGLRASVSRTSRWFLVAGTRQGSWERMWPCVSQGRVGSLPPSSPSPGTAQVEDFAMGHLLSVQAPSLPPLGFRPAPISVEQKRRAEPAAFSTFPSGARRPQLRARAWAGAEWMHEEDVASVLTELFIDRKTGLKHLITNSHKVPRWRNTASEEKRRENKEATLCEGSEKAGNSKYMKKTSWW